MRNPTSLMYYSQSVPFLELSFPVFKFPFVNTCLYTVPPTVYNVSTFQVAVLLSLILFHFQSRFRSVCMFRGHHWGFLTIRIYYGCRSSACRPTPNLEGQSTATVTPTCTPRHRVPLLVSFYDLEWAAVVLFFSPITTWKWIQWIDSANKSELF